MVPKDYSWKGSIEKIFEQRRERAKKGNHMDVVGGALGI